jgi:hypothetical protein
VKRKLNTEVDREMVISYIKRLDITKTYTVEVLQKKVRRTISQNALYWLWLTCIAYETGHDKHEVHEYFKKLYLQPVEVVMFYGEIVQFWSTRNLNTIQFKHYLDKIQVFAATELAITLPDPDDHHWETFYKYYIDKL